MSEPFADVDVAIVGAGAAGIAAGRAVMQAGRSCVLLEARDRAGGRAVTDRSLGVPADLGAAWLHYADSSPWTRFAREQGFTLVEREPDWGPRSHIGNRAPTPDEVRSWERAVRRYGGAIEAAARAGRDVALTEVLPRDALRPRYDAVMTWAVGAESREISTVDLARYADSTTNWSVREGLGAVVAAAARGLPVRTGARVERIRWSSRDVRVETSAGAVTARVAIVTVPPSVLARGEPAFDPPLPPTHRAAIDDLPLGVVNKVFFRFDDAELPPEPLFTIGSAETSRTAHYQFRPADQPLVLAFLGGDLSRELEARGELAAFAREELSRCFGADLVRRAHGTLETAWGADPFARGSYSVARPGAAAQREVLATPVAASLLFAGEACSRDRYGTLPGASESGEAAARIALRGLVAR